uniref:Reverse transcriptase Ty1/copia-type domain-containing protein n=1 Tax=Ananas comosus var. bracteatus TaxID=296719 RepID=A0A6V7PGK1_ANACO|nr:unnamed protein product [Ananas comosus var. bracteatus]
MLIAAKNMADVDDLKRQLKSEFDVKDLDATKKILSIEIQQNRKAKKLQLTQKGYIQRMLERFCIKDVKPVSTPLATHFKLSTDLALKTDDEEAYMERVTHLAFANCEVRVISCALSFSRFSGRSLTVFRPMARVPRSVSRELANPSLGFAFSQVLYRYKDGLVPVQR